MANKPNKLSDTAREPLTCCGDARRPSHPASEVADCSSATSGSLLARRRTGGGDAGAGRRPGLRLAHQRGRRGPHAAGDGPGAHPGREGETSTPTPEPIAAEAWETTGADAGIAVAGLPRLVTDLAVYDFQQAQDGLEGADGGRGPSQGVQGHADTAQAAVERPGAVPARGLRHSRLKRRRRLSSMAGTLVPLMTRTSPTLSGDVAALRSALATNASLAAATNVALTISSTR